MKGFWYWLKRLKSDIFVLYFLMKDPRVPGQAKALVILLTAYIFSPIDLIPDFFLPLLGYVDDVVLIPLGVEIVLKMLPEPLVQETRQKAAQLGRNAKNRAGAAAAFAAIVLALVQAYRFLKI